MLLVVLAEALPPRPPYPGPGLPVLLGLALPDSLVVELALKTSEAREVALGEVVPEVVEEIEALALGQGEFVGILVELLEFVFLSLSSRLPFKDLLWCQAHTDGCIIRCHHLLSFRL
jgi:hypothetical protein